MRRIHAYPAEKSGPIAEIANVWHYLSLSHHDRLVGLEVNVSDYWP